MNYVGIDLHKKTIVTCVMDQDRKITGRRTLACCQAREIRSYFESLQPFQAEGRKRGHSCSVENPYSDNH